ncbi:Mss4-like protein [Phaeosphaeriaceae sp. PMI808]|nr:Mss4-like protein [Phaeosphaeriaceae sp. PMI808]
MVEGRCNCGGIKVRLAELPAQSIICYCSNCRRAGSNIGSIVYVFEKNKVHIDDPNGNLKVYKDNDTKSGNAIIRQFCSNCGCPVASLYSEDSPKIILKAGLFEHIPPPTVKGFQQEEPAWIKISTDGF